MHRGIIFFARTSLIFCAATFSLSAAFGRGVDSIAKIEKLGGHLVKGHHVIDARRLLEPACRRPDSTCLMHCLLAKAYMDDPDLDPKVVKRVDSELQTAIKLNPSSGYAYRVWAEWDNLQGNYKAAIVHSKKALAVKDSENDAWRQLTIAYSNLGDYKAALECTERRFKLDGATEAHFLTKAALLEKLNRRGEAAQQYREALKVRNVDTTVNLLVDCLTTDGKYQDAIVEISQLIKKNPNDSEAIAKRAALQSKLKHYKEAIQDYTAALDLDPSPRLYTARAAVYGLNNQKKQADDDIAKAKKLSASNF